MPVLSAPRQPSHDLGATRFTSLATPSLGTVDTSVWRVEIDPDTPATPHSLTREEIFFVLHGTAAISVDGVSTTARPGDAIVVPSATRFELSNAGDTVLSMLCCLPVGGQAIVDGNEFTPPWAQ